MDNKELWDSLFQELDNMSDEEFLKLAKELEKQDDVFFAIDNGEPLPLDGVDMGVYQLKSAYNNQSQFNFNFTFSLDEEMAA